MMKPLNHILLLLLALLPAAFTACTQDDNLSTDQETISMQFTAVVGDEALTRAVGDASKVDYLIVGVFEDGTQKTQQTFTMTGTSTTAEVTLVKGRTYTLVFWAQNKEAQVYNTADLANVTIDYTQYTNAATAESFDAFYAVKTDVTASSNGGTVTLTRPFAQLCVGNALDAANTAAKTTVTLTGICNTFSPLTGTVSGGPVTNTEANAVTLTYTPASDSESAPQITVEGTTYNALAIAYLPATAEGCTATCTVDVYTSSETDAVPACTVPATTLTLKCNERINIVGNLTK